MVMLFINKDYRHYVRLTLLYWFADFSPPKLGFFADFFLYIIFSPEGKDIQIVGWRGGVQHPIFYVLKWRVCLQSALLEHNKSVFNVFLQTMQINTHLFFVCYQPDAVCSPRQSQAERADTATQLMDSHLGEQAHEYVKNLSYIAVIIFQFHENLTKNIFKKSFYIIFLRL